MHRIARKEERGMSRRRRPPIPADTTSEAAAVQGRLHAEMEPADRMRAALEMSVAVRGVARAGLERRSEALSDEEITERIIEICYGGPP